MAEDSQQTPTLVALEEKLTFQQRQFDELNSVVLKQQAELDRQRRELANLARMLQGLMDRTGEDLPHEKPPHY
ncbi:SlyX family protein [Bythopirellula polymerisocia]|uniref:Protein SlyX n=1 Tax=Bythopirellula polymerisocia TaxID=2528003 RepID=A0A5C6CXG0_9BACT|nr:SlyX family protein [Bythopirellula polymerisocia]TWU29623.1 hypothetical protein Pla144_04010 [Bythopirellula polymerisocia]